MAECKKICPVCGTEFTLSHPNQKYCSKDCQIIASREASRKYQREYYNNRGGRERGKARYKRDKQRIIKNESDRIRKFREDNGVSYSTSLLHKKVECIAQKYNIPESLARKVVSVSATVLLEHHVYPIELLTELPKATLQILAQKYKYENNVFLESGCYKAK